MISRLQAGLRTRVIPLFTFLLAATANGQTGETNQVLPVLTDVIINEILAHTDPPLEDAVELYNPTGGPIDIGGWYLSDDAEDLTRYCIPAGTVIPAGGFTVIYEAQFNAAGRTNPTTPFTFNAARGGAAFLTQADASGTLLAMAEQPFGASENGVSFGRHQAGDKTDFVAMSARSFGQDNPRSLAQFREGTGLPNPAPLIGPLVINEIMYHPPDIGTNDNTLDEFIEIRNVTSVRVPLFDPHHPTNRWRLRDAVGFKFPTATWIAPDGYVLVVPFNPEADPDRLSLFRTRHDVPETVPVLGPYDGKLSNDGESVDLLKPDPVQRPPHPDAGYVPYVLVDRVEYSSEVPWPPQANGTSYSLQRKDRRLYGNDPTNWKAGLPTAGRPNGTPPAITLQPAAHTYIAGGSVTFSVAVTGARPLTYQWYLNGSDLPDANAATLLIPNMSLADIGRYSVLVANVEGSVLSEDATLRLDRKKPVLRITSPRPNARMSDEVLIVRGTVQDNFGLMQVLVSLNGGAFQPAQGTTNWSIPLQLSAGTNVIRARAIDLGMNESSLAELRVFHVVNAALTVARSGGGEGALSPDLNGALLEVGRGYTISAKPAANSFFSNWTGFGADGPIDSRNPVLRFLMQPGLTLNAAFVPNPFLSARGAYNGLFFEAGEVRHARSGFFTTTVTDRGAYSASLRIGSKRHPISGRFDLSGQATNRMGTGTNTVTVELALGLGDNMGRITGIVRGNGWEARLHADQAALPSSTNLAALAGACTFVVPGDPDPARSPGGDGFGKVRISTDGRLTFAGVLGDGSKASQKIPISQTGDWPFYVSLYGGKGSILGWANVTNRDDADVTGALNWIKPTRPGGLYPFGFTNQSLLIGSRYAWPDAGRVLNFSNAFLAFIGGNLSNGFTNELVLTEDNRITNRSGGKLRFNIAPATGAFTGTADDPATGRPISFKGVVLQKQNRASGHFLGPAQSGRVSLDP